MRLRYADVPLDRIDRLRETDVALDRAVADATPGARVYVLATYTAMLDLHRQLADRGLTEPFWEERR